MLRSLLALLCLCFLVLGPSAAGAQILLLDYVGFDYESPDPDPSGFGEIGAGYNGIGQVPVIAAPLTFDPGTNEYTYFISGLTVASRLVIGDFVIIDYSGPGTIQVYEDLLAGGTAADYGTNPPNGTAPSSFTDGTLLLEGAISNFQFIWNTATNSGSYESEFDATGGSQIGNIPVGERDGWTFAGATSNDLGIPTGYEHQIDGQIFLNSPIAVQVSTWGRLKSGLFQ